MTTDFRALCAELLSEFDYYSDWSDAEEVKERARAALAEPQRRCIYNPVQIAECGGPCQQGAEYCDCGELWITEPEIPSESPTDEELTKTYWDAVHSHPERHNHLCNVAGLRAVLARWGCQ